MTIHTGAVFNNGVVAKLLDVLVAARATTPATPSGGELARINRTLDSNAAVRWAMPSASLSALLDLISEDLERSGDARLPVGFAERLTAAAGQQDRSEFLRDTAAALRALQQEGIPRFDELPMSSWEAELRFSILRDFSWWVESDEYDDFEEGVLAGVTSEHPDGCAERVPPLIAELHAALLLETDLASSAALLAIVPWATPPVLRAILRLASSHLLEAH
ncbi:hypothetical protein OG564_28130 [Streptomyces sp. NBC_01280]|uniref:hypothetical protein n=1 Tax=Streptomyces sp. NBC_01280 TaxID=2903810 RepID=UPI002E2F6332|nr:hypothetical protein [Streptomyces sp. NBC_01280]